MTSSTWQTFKFPTLPTLPNFSPEVTEKISKVARDVAYTSIGLSVLAFQKTQVRRRELMEQFQTCKPEVATQVSAQVDAMVTVAAKAMTARINARRSDAATN